MCVYVYVYIYIYFFFFLGLLLFFSFEGGLCHQAQGTLKSHSFAGRQCIYENLLGKLWTETAHPDQAQW